MVDFAKEIKERAGKIGYEMRGLAQDMSVEMREMRDIMKEKTEKIGDEIKKKMMR